MVFPSENTCSGFRAASWRRLAELGVRGRTATTATTAATTTGRWGIWGRSGQLAALGVAVRDWVTWYGAYVNVCPAMGLFRLVRSDPADGGAMGCLVAERQGSVRMATVRAALTGRLSEAFGCDRYHLYTGHPWLGRGGRGWQRHTAAADE